MSNKKQSSVEWFQEQTWNLSKLLEKQQISVDEFGIAYYDLFQQAKAMHKEEQKQTFQESRLTHPMIVFKHTSFERYYNETYGGGE